MAPATSAAAVPPPAAVLPSGPDETEYRHGGWRELLGNRRYLLYLGSSTFAGAGYAVYSVSVLFLAYGLSGNLLIAGVVLFIEYGVYTATFLVAPLVDRARDKRAILLVCYPLQALAAAALALELHAGTLSVPVLLGLVLVLAVLWDFVWAVFMVAPPIVLPKRQLFVADGLSSVVSVGTQVGGYAGGGALVYFVGPYGGASAYAVLLLAALLFAVPLALPIERPPTTHFLETFRRGWDLFRGKAGARLRALASVDTVFGFFSAVPPLLLPAIAFQRFAPAAPAYAVLVSAYALGGSLAGVVVGHYNPRRRVGTLLVLTPLGAGLGVLALGPSGSTLALLAVLLGGVGAASTVRYNAKYAWVQGSYAPELLGRLSANLYLFAGVAGSLAVLLTGSASVGVPLSTLELLDGIGLLAAGLATVAIPVLRRLAF